MTSLPGCIQAARDGTHLSIRAHARASRERVGPATGNTLDVWVTAPPVEGAANEAVLRVVAERIGCRRGAVRLVRGQSSRQKVVHIEGLTPAEVLARLEAS